VILRWREFAHRVRWRASLLLVLVLPLVLIVRVGAQTPPAQNPAAQVPPGQTVPPQSAPTPAPNQSPQAQGAVSLEAQQQRREGDTVIADGDVDVHYQSTRLRADHLEYDTKTYDTRARGNVQFDYENQHLEGSEATFNVRTGRGEYQHVRGTVKVVRIPNAQVLLSSNPLYVEAEQADRIDERT